MKKADFLCSEFISWFTQLNVRLTFKFKSNLTVDRFFKSSIKGVYFTTLFTNEIILKKKFIID